MTFSISDNQIDNISNEKFLLVTISSDLYAFRIDIISELIPMQEIKKTNFAGNMVGIISWQDETIPVFDFNNFLGQESIADNNKQKIVIIKIETTKLAIIVDDIKDIIPISKKDVSVILDKNYPQFLSTTIIDGNMVFVVDESIFYKHIDISTNTAITVQNTNLIEQNSAKTNAVGNTTYQGKFVIFRLAKEIYALNISYVKEIKKINLQNLNKIPCTPDFIKGVINVGGDYVSLLDIKPFLNLETGILHEKNDILILDLKNLKIAILVDEICDITNFMFENIDGREILDDSYIYAEIPYKDNKVVNILNVEKMFSEKNLSLSFDE